MHYTSHMYLVVTPKEIMAHRNYVVKSAGGGKKYNHEQKRINNASMVILHCLVDSVHHIVSALAGIQNYTGL
jgi:hypothetical protein